MKTSEAINEIAAALSKAQGDLMVAKKGANNPFFKSKYSDLSMVIEAISTPFAENGLSFVQAAESDSGLICVTTRIMHNSGQWIESITTLPATKNDAQGYGSAITYAKRYGLQSLAGVPSEDDDGNAAVKHQAEKKVTKASLTKIESDAIDKLFRFSESKDATGMSETYSELTKIESEHVWQKLPIDTQNYLIEALK